MTENPGPVVVDASVAVKWLIPEPDWEQAVQVLDLAPALHAPELMQLEVANVLWKRVRSGEISQAEAETSLAELRSVALEYSPVAPLVTEALCVACLADCSVYEGLYVALARQTDAVPVTQKIGTEPLFHPMVNNSPPHVSQM